MGLTRDTRPPSVCARETEPLLPSIMASRPSLDDLLRDVPPERLDQPCTQEHLIEIAPSVIQWQTVAPFLGLTEGDEEAIVTRNPNNVNAQKIAMLRTWKERFGSIATYRKLAEAFWKVGKTDLAERVCSLLPKKAEPSRLPPQTEGDRRRRVGTTSASVQPGKYQLSQAPLHHAFRNELVMLLTILCLLSSDLYHDHVGLVWFLTLPLFQSTSEQSE